MTRHEALAALLALPDEPCLLGLLGQPRGRTYTYARDPLRDPWTIKRDLGVAYAERARQEWTDGDISCVVSFRRQPLKIVMRA